MVSPRIQTTTLDATFAALAHPARRQILVRLRRGRARVTELAAPHDLSLPSVSRHLKVLEGAGLIQREREGKEFIFELIRRPGADALRWLERHQRFWDRQLEELERYAKTLSPKDDDGDDE